jgi:hypothetical protein
VPSKYTRKFLSALHLGKILVHSMLPIVLTVSFYCSVICVTVLFKSREDVYYSAWDHHILKFREVEISLTSMPCALDLKLNLLLFFVMFENCKLKLGKLS